MTPAPAEPEPVAPRRVRRLRIGQPRSLQSRLGAWASHQSQPLESRAALMAEVARVTAKHGPIPKRPPFWGGYRIVPVQVEFWADGMFRLHDRFRWTRKDMADSWQVVRLNP